ncbi:MAG TPA: hypothetical protein DCX80_05865 [Chloroflexi bacterium]|nr:hypothetical protein [Chloroflexota bacterium]
MAGRTTQLVVESPLRRFAERLHEELGASRVLLFGSRARGMAASDSDYDVIVVAEHFAHIDPAARARGLRAIWYEEGGDGPMDILCLTPREFDLSCDRVTLIAAVAPETIDLLAS